MKTSLAGSATLGDISWAWLTSELTRWQDVWDVGGVHCMYIPIEGFYWYVQTRVGTPHKIFVFYNVCE